MNDILLTARAADFAARRHAGQRRKGASAEPYLNHLAEVAFLLAEASGDATLVAAGWLHDTVEDTCVTREELEELFGPAVASLVAEVTDDKSLAKAERKRLQVANVGHKSVGARLIKIADKTSNLRSLTSSPPTDWERTRLDEYVTWASEVVQGCRGLNDSLERAFDAAVLEARSAIAGRFAA